jgi:hypothetical protein
MRKLLFYSLFSYQIKSKLTKTIKEERKSKIIMGYFIFLRYLCTDSLIVY